MRIILKSAIIAASLACASLAGTAGASAAVGVTFDIGNVALGYSDGYWDNNHHWHKWAHRADMLRYQKEHHENYHSWRHDDPKHKNDDHH
jgi:hypothetical protein